MIRTGPATVRSYAVAWRQDNVTAELEANGFRLTTPEMLALGKRYESSALPVTGKRGTRR